MNSLRRLAVFLALSWMLPAGGKAAAPASPEPTVSTAESDNYSEVTCSGTNAGVVADVLDLATDARDRLTQVLHLGRKWRFPVHIHVVMPDDPAAAKLQTHFSSVLPVDNTLKIEAVVASNDPQAREFIQRQYVTAILWEKFFPADQKFTPGTRVDIVPLWLIEGLREWINDDPSHDREGIVKRAAMDHHAPSLAEITSWVELSDDRLLGLWERAFCYYLAASMIENGSRRDEFQDWLAAATKGDLANATLLFPTESAWQSELTRATSRGRDLIYTWDESSGEITVAEAVSIPDAKGAEAKIYSLDDVITLPHDAQWTAGLQKKIVELTTLELRAHPSWTPIIALYRFGLSALMSDKTPDRAKKFFQQAREERIAENARHKKLVDYMNWFEVTRDNSTARSPFVSYFSVAHNLEQAQADPTHPNPLRADLLHVESQF